jgi:hypothetical protein
LFLGSFLRCIDALIDNHSFLKKGIALFGTIGAFGMAHVVHMGQNELLRAKKGVGSH